MKKSFIFILMTVILLSACGPSNQITPSESAPTVTPTSVPSTPKVTEIPATATFTPTPTLSLPVSQLTPVPSASTKITAENVKDLQEIARYYGEVNYMAKLTKDNKYLFILDPDGLTKYNYATMESITHIGLANSVSDMQISNDGGLLILDNNWLLDLKNDKEPRLHILSEKIHLLNFYTRTFSLSPYGTVMAVEQNQLKCDTCEHIFRIVSTEDFTDLYTSSGLTHQSLPTFSSDGQYFALANLFIEAHPDGSSNPTGASVSVWTTTGFTRVTSFSVKFPFYVTDIAFSDDKNLLAIAQRTSIDIYDVISGEAKATIANLCDSYQRQVMFALTAPLRVLESSDCGSGEWTISGRTATLSSSNVPDLSRIVFDEKGNIKEIPYVYPTTSSLRAYRDQYYLKFLNNDILGFKNFDLETLDRHSCDLSLTNGSLDCQSHTPEYNNGRYLGKDVILATDGKYYGYLVGKSTVDIYPIENPSQIYYSIPFRDYAFDLLALDPTNNIIIYQIALSMSINRIVIQDMKDDRVLEKWEGETSLDRIVFSGDKKHMALCRGIGYTNAPNKDRLLLFDLSEKRTIYNTEFTCIGTALAISSDGTKLAAEHRYAPDPNISITRLTIFDTTPPYEEKYLDFDSWFYPHAVSFSPDGSMLSAACRDTALAISSNGAMRATTGSDICFFDAVTIQKIYQLQAHSNITNLAFSPDGHLLATSSDWGLIGLWGVPPFEGITTEQTQTSPLSSHNPSYYWDFDQDDHREGWGEEDWHSVNLENIRVKEGYLSATATSSGPILYSRENLGIDASRFSQIEIRMRVSAGEYAQLYFRDNNNDMSEEMSKTFSIQSGTEFQTYVIEMSDVSTWKGVINQLRLDPTRDGTGAYIEIDYIHLLSSSLPSSSFSWNFDESDNREGWDNWAELDNVEVQGGYLSAKTSGSDPQIYSSEGLSIEANKFSRIEIRMQVSTGDSAQLFFRNYNNDLSEEKSIIFPIESGTEFKTYILDMSKIPTWKDTIFQLRLDPTSDVDGATIEIDYIRLLP